MRTEIRSETHYENLLVTLGKMQARKRRMAKLKVCRNRMLA